ncbi:MULTISPECIES: hemagglutinin repeat-containing protein [unclassified Microbulbifer]|uniref:two-partner secretion domain-containing protein n=1 Tax=unclassified Microbulbifer TaxID=2619833 RepID=UPI0027E5666A|nr:MULTISPECIES: hemagglutinin repeat-containing protein [unclassified Microbulbifer]
MHRITISTKDFSKPASRGMRALTLLLCLQLILPANLLAEVVVDKSAEKEKQAEVERAANGVEMVNITAANQRGVSHNKYEKFNVDASGLILNNDAGIHQSQLGGQVAGNNNLAQSGSASLILNEVTQANRSSLKGHIEISGRAAELVIANPYGITCAGCGFINTPRATLTSGVPRLQDGQLTGFDIRSGEVAMEGSGLDASGLNNLDIWARSIKLSAPLLASDLSLIAGVNRVAYGDRQVSLLSSSGEKPQLAIDASALGAIQANRIFMLATEQGVGVRSRADMSSAGDFTLTADGRIQLSSAVAGEDARIQSSGQLSVDERLYGAQVSISAQKTANSGMIAAESSLSIEGAELQNNGSLLAGIDRQGEAVAGGVLEVRVSDSLGNSGLVAAENVQLHSAIIENRSGEIQADELLSLSGQTLDNSGGEIYALGGGHTQLTFDQVANRKGVIQSNSERLSLFVKDSLDNSGGKLLHFGEGLLALNVGAALDNTGGQIQSAQSLRLDALSLDNSGGLVTALGGESTQLNLTSFTNSGGLIQSASRQLSLFAQERADNSNGSLLHFGSGGFSVDAGSLLRNSGGQILSAGALSLAGESLDNSGGEIYALGGDGAQLTFDELSNRSGLIQTQGDNLSIAVSSSADNSGGRLLHFGEGAVSLDVGAVLDNRDGQIQAEHDLALSALSLENSRGSVTALSGASTLLNLGLLDNSGGLIQSKSDTFTIATQSAVDNSEGGILYFGADRLSLDVGTALLNSGGKIQSAAGLWLGGDSLDNSGGEIYALGGESSQLSFAQLGNHNGLIQSQSDAFSVSAQDFANNGGRLLHFGQGSLSLAGETLDNEFGLIQSSGIFAISGSSLDNSDGVINALGGETSQLQLDSLVNRGGAIQSRSDTFALSVQSSADNSGGSLLHFGEGLFSLEAGIVLNSDGGQIQSEKALLLSAQSLDNSGGTITTLGGDSARFQLSALRNNGGVIQSQSDELSISAKESIQNIGGTLKQLGAGGLQLSTDGDIDSAGGRLSVSHQAAITAHHLSLAGAQVSADRLQLALSGDLDNSDGLIDTNRLIVESGALNNRGGSLRAVAAEDGSLLLNVSTIDNRGGVIETAALNLSLSLERFDNTGGELRHGGSGELSLTLLDQLTNRGKILSNGAIRIDTQNFLNSDLSVAGTLIAAGNLWIDAGEAVNSGGTVEAGGALAINLQALDNRSGQIQSLGGAEFSLIVDGGLDNSQGGTLASAATDMRVQVSGGLNNAAGSLLHSGSGQLTVDAGGAIDNRAGEITGNGSLLMDGNDEILNGGKGWISASGNLTLDAAGQLDNSGGTVASAGNFSIQAQEVRNVGGTLAGAGQAFNLASRGAIDNRNGGSIETAAQSAGIEAATAIDNRGGRVSHAGDGQLNVIAARVNNSGGGTIGSNGGLRLNTAGNPFNNNGGTLLAVTDLWMNARGLDNRNGYIEQGSGLLNLLLGSGSLLNTDGEIYSDNHLSAQAAAIDGGSGVIQGRNKVTLNADSVALEKLGDVRAEQQIAIDSQGKITQTAGFAFRTDADLTLTAKGQLENAGEISSAGALDIQVQGIDNRAGGVISGSSAKIGGGALVNRGRLSGADSLRLEGTSLANHSGAVIASGGDLTAFITGLIGNDALIFAGANLNLYSDRLINDRADIYALGSIHIARDQSSAKNSRVENISGLIESRNGTIRIDSANIVNRRTHLDITRDESLSALDLIDNPNEVFLFDQALLGWSVPGQSFETNEEWVSFWVDRHIERLNSLPGGDIPQGVVDDVKDSLYPWANFTGIADKDFVWNILKREIEYLEEAVPQKIAESRNALSAQLSNVKPGFQVVDFELGRYDSEGERDYLARIEHTYTGESTYREKVDSAGAAAQLMAGGDLILNGGGITNRYSTISAGGNIQMTGSSLDNIGRELQRKEEITRTVYGYHKGDYKQIEGESTKIHTTVVDSVPALIHAGGNITGTFTGKINNETISGGVAYNSDNQRSPETSTSGKAPRAHSKQSGRESVETGALDTSAPDGSGETVSIDARQGEDGEINGVVGEAVRAAETVDQSGPQNTAEQNLERIAEAGKAALDPLATHGFQLPDGGLFVQNLEAGSPYLIETNPAITDYANFISSDYFLGQLDLDAEALPKRLGDGFYENQILRDSIFQATGQRFLHPSLASDYDQYQWLMDNAVATAEDLDLSVGVALTSEQIALLETDIVWLVESEIQGQTVLVPVIYLADIDNRQLLANGALISAGGDIQLSGSEIHNSGGLKSGGRLALFSEGSIVNKEGDLVAGGDLLARADRDIHNLSGRIQGNSVLLNAGGSIVSETLTRTLEKSSIEGSAGLESTNTAVAGLASISATGGKLVMQAGEDMRLIASRLDAATDAQLVAGGDLVLDTKALEERSAAWTASGHNIRERTQHLTSGIEAGGNLQLASGGDTRLSGAELTAGGDVGLQAGGDITIASVTNSQTTDYRREEKGSGTFDKDKTVTEQDHSEQVVGSNITAKGGQVTVAADGDVVILGSQVNADKDIALSGQDITVAASAYEESHLSAKTESGGFENESLGEASYQLQLAASELNSASGNISLDAAKNITLAAGNLVAGSGDINLTAVDDLLIAAGEVIESTSSWSEDSGYFSGGDFYSSEQQSGATQQTLAQGSQISAGNDINIHAGRAKIIGSDLSAGNDIVAETDIGDLEILAARETTHTTQDEKQVRVSAGDAAQSLADPDDLVKVEDGQLKIKLADAEYHQLDSESTQVSHKGSNLSAGNDIELNAIGDLTIEGSNLAADGDTSGEGDVVLSGENVTIKEAKDSLQTKTSETTGSAEMSVVVQHQAVEVAKAAVALQESADNLKQAKEDYRKYQKDLDNLEDTLDQLEADYANGAPGVTQADIVELKQIIDDAEGDKEWYLAGVAAAAADVTAKTTLLVQQTATAAQSTATYGFNAGVQLDIDASKTDTESHQTSSLASSLSGSNIRIQTGSGNGGETTGNTLIQGSHLQADNQIAIDTGDLDITASQDTASSRTQTEHGHISVQQTVYGATGGPAVNASMDRSQSRDRQTSYNNSTLNADSISLNTTGDAALTGANVHANSQLDVNIAGDLIAESQQNRASGSNTSAGISGGFGTSGGKDSSLASVNGGANSANGRYQSKETVLTSLTAGGEATVDVGGHTQVTGALIATLDEEGNDLGNLELSTGTLDYADLSNTNYQSQQSAGISISVGLNGANPADPAQQNAQDATGNDDLKLNTSNVQYSNNSHYSKDKSLATVGQGNITVRDEDSDKNGDLAGLNRDVTNTEKELFEVDRQEGNIDVTVDHRVLSKQGWEEISQDTAALKEAAAVGADYLESVVVSLPEELAEQTGPLGEGMHDTLIRQGYDPEEAQALLADPDFQQYVVETANQLREDIESADPETLKALVEENGLNLASTDAYAVDANGEFIEHVQTDSVTGQPLAGKVNEGLATANDYLNTLDPNTRDMAMLATSFALGGPVKQVAGVVINEMVNAAAGEQIEQATEAVAEGVTEWAIGERQEDGTQADEAAYDRAVDGSNLGISIATGIGLPGRKINDRESHSSNSSGNPDGDFEGSSNHDGNIGPNPGVQPGAADAEAGDLSIRNDGDSFDLDYHENHVPPGSRNSGHLLERHVGLSDADLIARSNGAGGQRIPLGGSSSFSSRQAAEHYVNQTMRKNETEIKAWLEANPGTKPKAFDSLFNQPTGRHVPANSSTASNVNGVRVVLQADSTSPSGYRIITGHPIGE